MNSNTKVLIIITLLLAACQPVAPQGSGANPTEPSMITPTMNLPNPASLNCEEKGYTLEIRTAADGSQQGFCIFPDGSECDEWAYYRRECTPASQGSPTSTPAVEVATPTFAQTEIPTPLPIDPADYQGWWAYTHAVYNFSIMLPEDWVVEEITTNDPLMNGHILSLHPNNEPGRESIRMTFRRVGEEALLWPTGVGQGEFILHGTLDVAGQAAQRVLLVCPTGEITAVWYHHAEGQPNITRRDLEFGFIFTASSLHCEAGYSLSGNVQHVGEMIIASLNVP
jgi:putative hemolysin